MRIPRIFHPKNVSDISEVCITEDEAHHILTVLRLKTGDKIELFDNTNFVYEGIIVEIHKKTVSIKINNKYFNDKESNLHIHLGQVISRGDKMDFTIQKAVELGVNEITALYSERCGVKLDHTRMEKKLLQWQKIIINACKQSGRNKIPHINPICNIDIWLAKQINRTNLTLNPKATLSIPKIKQISNNKISLLIGSEGGLTDKEIMLAKQHNFIDIFLGKRILRTETAGLVAISILQATFGDLA